MAVSTATLEILEPVPGLYAYYDGRRPGRRLYASEPNWLDDGGYDLGIASYALVANGEALVYDTHLSLPHARAIRDHLEALGVDVIRVALSHWHADHVAGNGVFADREIIASRATADALAANRDALASGTPAIAPLVLPTRTFEGRMDLRVGGRRAELHPFAIHSADGTVLWLPDEGVLLAGDTLEDTITYVAEAQHVATHVRELDRLRSWPISRILPNHGDPHRIASGGYDATLIDANSRYLRRLTQIDERDRSTPLEAFIADDLRSGAMTYFAPYEAVHRRNLAAVLAVPGGT